MGGFCLGDQEAFVCLLAGSKRHALLLGTESVTEATFLKPENC